MRYGKTVEQTVLRETHVTCDICGADIKHKGWDGSDVTIRADIGEQYPECDCRESAGIDCCTECWERNVRPAIEALGAKFREWRTEDGYPLVREPKAEG